MRCWICGDEGDSEEHILKASDVRGYFGTISQDKPVYFHSENKRNIPVGSAKANRLKSKGLICKKCNNQLTQSHDRAWEILSIYLRRNWTNIVKSKRLNLSKIFPGMVRKQTVNVHLYFVKLFGCRIAEYRIPIDLSGFSKAILDGEPNEHVFLVFGQTPMSLKTKHAGITEVHSVDVGGKSIGAAWIYTLGDLSVKVFFSPIVKKGPALANAWHPHNRSKILKLARI